MKSYFVASIARGKVYFCSQAADSYKVLIAGGGSGGLATSAIFARKLGKGAVGIVEPSIMHYYQPMWTLVGAGIKSLQQSQGLTQDYIPRKATWIRDSVASFDPINNQITTLNASRVLLTNEQYVMDKLRIPRCSSWNQARFPKGKINSGMYTVFYHGLLLGDRLSKVVSSKMCPKIGGLEQALLDPDSSVCCNYSPQSVGKTFQAIMGLQNGNAIFTFPDTPVKCAGAAQKIMYLTECYHQKNGKKDVKYHYMTPQDSIFMVPKYCKALEKVIEQRGILFHPKQLLKEIDNEKQEAIFIKIGSSPTELVRYKFSMLHVTPPMSAPDVIKKSPLSDPKDPYGYMEVDKEYLCHPDYPNVYGIGDCTNAPKSKTLAAITSELKTVKKNLSSAIDGKPPFHKSIGYSSCPLVVSYDKCILAEFDYDKTPIETFPVDQSVPRRSMMLMKKYGMPLIYWHAFLRGYWEGPSWLRKFLRLGMT